MIKIIVIVAVSLLSCYGKELKTESLEKQDSMKPPESYEERQKRNEERAIETLKYSSH